MVQYQITVRNKEQVEICSCKANQTLAQALLYSQIIPVACVGGGCGICRVVIKHGKYSAKWMNRNYVSETEQQQGLALACLIYPRSHMEVEVLGRKPKAFQTKKRNTD